MFFTPQLWGYLHVWTPQYLSPRCQVRRNGCGPGRGREAAVRGRYDAARMAGRAHVAQQVLRDETRILHARRGGVDEPRNDDLENVPQKTTVVVKGG